MKKIWQIIFLFILIFSFLHSEDKGKLESFEDEVKEPIKHNSEHHENVENDQDDDEDSIFEILIRAIVYEIFIGSEPELNRYKIQPYIYHEKSFGRYGNNGSAYDLDLEFDYLYHSKDLVGFRLKGNFIFAKFLSIKLDYQKFQETNGLDQDEMEIIDFFLDYYRLGNPLIDWYWGIGMKVLNRQDEYLGFGLNSGIEVYPFKPFSMNLAANISWLNEHPVYKMNADIGINFWRFKCSAGYQRLKTGSVKIDTFTLGLGINF